MSKRQIKNRKDGKKMGRSHGPIVVDPVLGDKVSTKIFNSRKKNNPKRYQKTNAAE